MKPNGNGLVALHDDRQKERGFNCMRLIAYLTDDKVTEWGSATVRACGSAYCSSWSLMECKLSDNALYRVRSTNTVYYANDNIKFQKQ